MARLDDRLDREFDPRTAKVLAKALDNAKIASGLGAFQDMMRGQIA